MGTLGTLRDVAVIFIAVLDLVLLLVLIVAAYFALKGVRWLHEQGVPILRTVRTTADQVAAKTDAGAEKVAGGAIRASGWASAAEGLVRSLVTGRRST